MNKAFTLILGGLAVALIFVSQAFYIVDQREQVILLQLGQPVGNPQDSESFIKGPGLHMKIPLIQEVRRFDGRILSVDPAPEQVVISSSSLERPAEDKEETKDEQTERLGNIDNVTGEPIILDTFARYKIIDPLQFLKTLRSINGANSRLENILKDATKAELGQTSLKELLSPRRTQVMRNIQGNVNRIVQRNKFGIEIVDVRIVRADLTAELLTSTVRRMQSELKERATETRAKGEERALEIRSTAEKERTVLIAEAERDAQILRGKGDEEAIKIYANAFNKDKDFYAFIRSMEAYSNTLADPETQLILSPNSQFFRYFKDKN